MRLITLSRPDQWVVTAVPFLAGYILTGQPLDGFFWLALIYLLWPYNLLIHGTEGIFSVRAPALPRRTGVWILLVNLLFLTPLLWIATEAGYLLLAAMTITAMAFGLKGFRLRDTPLLDAITVGFLTAAPLALAWVDLDWQSSQLTAVIVLALWGMGQYSFGTLRSVHDDLLAGTATTAVLLGPQRTVMLSAALFVAAAVLLLSAYGRPALPAGPGLAIYAVNAARFLGVRNPELFETGRKAFSKLNYLAASLALILLFL
jgi:4-hydroxybenzoate polyprenyltransferase